MKTTFVNAGHVGAFVFTPNGCDKTGCVAVCAEKLRLPVGLYPHSATGDFLKVQPC